MDGEEMVPLALILVLALAVVTIIWGPWVFG